MRPQKSLLLLLVSICLFASALTQDGYLIDEPDPHAWAPARALLLIGWIGIAHGQFAWLGNPLLIMSWIQFNSGKFTLGLKFACAALIFMLSFLLYPTVVSSEAPDYSKITSYELGYWLWVMSAATTVAAQYLAVRSRRETRGVRDQSKAEIL